MGKSREKQKTQGFELHFFCVVMISAGRNGTVIPGSSLLCPPHLYYFFHISFLGCLRGFSLGSPPPVQDDGHSQFLTSATRNCLKSPASLFSACAQPVKVLLSSHFLFLLRPSPRAQMSPPQEARLTTRFVACCCHSPCHVVRSCKKNTSLVWGIS